MRSERLCCRQSTPLGLRLFKGWLAQLAAGYGHHTIIEHRRNGHTAGLAQGLGCPPKHGCPGMQRLRGGHTAQPFQTGCNQAHVTELQGGGETFFIPQAGRLIVPLERGQPCQQQTRPQRKVVLISDLASQPITVCQKRLRLAQLPLLDG